MEVFGFYISRPRRTAAAAICSLFSLGLLLRVFSYFNHAFVMTIHAVYALTCFCEDEFVNAVVADFALETVGMI